MVARNERSRPPTPQRATGGVPRGEDAPPRREPRLHDGEQSTRWRACAHHAPAAGPIVQTPPTSQRDPGRPGLRRPALPGEWANLSPLWA